MVNLHELLKLMIERKASDLHITTGTPPQLRVDGALTPLDIPSLPAAEKTMREPSGIHLSPDSGASFSVS